MSEQPFYLHYVRSECAVACPPAPARGSIQAPFSPAATNPLLANAHLGANGAQRSAAAALDIDIDSSSESLDAALVPDASLYVRTLRA